MSSFKYSYNAIVFTGEDFTTQVKRLSRFGYDAIELVGEPDWYDFAEVRRVCEEFGIKVSSICSMFTTERDLSHPDAERRRKGVDYCREIADMAAAVGAPIMIAAPSVWNKMHPLAPPDQERGWAVENLQTVGEYANSVGVGIAIEPWNRYETYVINRLDQALELLAELDLPNAGVHGDMFHMAIEEASISDAYARAGKHLTHTHIADSNRAAPGTGHSDFKPVLQTLLDIGFDGYLTMELLPATADPFGWVKEGRAEEFKDSYVEQSITHLKRIEQEVIPSAGA